MLIDDMQKVNIAYVKDNDPVGFVRRSEVLYADKKEPISFFAGWASKRLPSFCVMVLWET